MTSDLHKKLTKTYPKILSKPMYGIECDDGWYDLLYHLCREIQSYVDQNGCPAIIATQIKEKFGSLRFYYHMDIDQAPLDEVAQDNCYKAIDAIVDRYVTLSHKTCEDTGNVGSLCKRGHWMKTLCKESAVLLGYEAVPTPSRTSTAAIFLSAEPTVFLSDEAWLESLSLQKD